MLTLTEPEQSLWERFERGLLSERDLDAHPVVKRWIRSRALGALGGVSSAPRPSADTVAPGAEALVVRASALLEWASADLQPRGFVSVLTDHDGILLVSRGVEACPCPELRGAFAAGVDLSEAALGTNAIGTALAEQTAVAVLGRAHYWEAGHQLCCYAAPLRDAADRVVAALGFVGPHESADPLLEVVVQSLAAALESRLRLQQLGHRDGGVLVRGWRESSPCADGSASSSRACLAGAEPAPRDGAPRTRPTAADFGAVARLLRAIGVAVADADPMDRRATTARRSARELVRQFGAVLDTLPVAVWVADACGNIALSNEAARRLWGGELLVPLEQYDRFKAWWPDGRRVTSEEWGLSRALRSGEVVVDDEVRIETFDGHHKVIRNLAAPIVDRAGRVIGGIAVNEDITLAKRAEAARDLFMGILGHDLRSPLSAIAISAALLDQKSDLAAAQRQSVARIRSSAGRIQRLVDDLLDFTRARFDVGLPVRPAPVDLGEVAACVVDEVRAAHPAREILLERQGSLRGDWDPARAAQVVANLLGNAVQHGADPIRVDVRDAGDGVDLSVSNGGEPISAGKRASLFEPFRKGDESKGVGLGLFIAREILRSHGGSLEVESVATRTTFTSRWPRARADARAPRAR